MCIKGCRLLPNGDDRFGQQLNYFSSSIGSPIGLQWYVGSHYLYGCAQDSTNAL